MTWCDVIDIRHDLGDDSDGRSPEKLQPELSPSSGETLMRTKVESDKRRMNRTPSRWDQAVNSNSHIIRGLNG